MSTFMGYAAADLRREVAVADYVAALQQSLNAEQDSTGELAVWVRDHGNHIRVTLSGDTSLGNVIARASGHVDRALIGLDLDEYGVEHVVLDGRSGGFVRVHHVYVYPEGEATDAFGPLLGQIPAREDLRVNADGTLTGVDALAAAAALFDVGADRMVTAVRETAGAHEHLQIVFVPLAPWWTALGVTYPVPDLGEPTTVLLRGREGAA